MFKIISYLHKGGRAIPTSQKIYQQMNFTFATGHQKKPIVCYYKLLNVSTKATADEIKESYYKLGKNYYNQIQSLYSQEVPSRHYQRG